MRDPAENGDLTPGTAQHRAKFIQTKKKLTPALNEKNHRQEKAWVLPGKGIMLVPGAAQLL